MIKLINTCSPHSSDFAYTGKLTALMRILELEEFVVIKVRTARKLIKPVRSWKLSIIGLYVIPRAYDVAIQADKNIRTGDHVRHTPSILHTHENLTLPL